MFKTLDTISYFRNLERSIALCISPKVTTVPKYLIINIRTKVSTNVCIGFKMFRIYINTQTIINLYTCAYTTTVFNYTHTYVCLIYAPVYSIVYTGIPYYKSPYYVPIVLYASDYLIPTSCLS